MFSPEASVNSARASSLRNPRRRQRDSDSASLQKQPHRKRSKLSEDTYKPKDAHINGNGSALMNGHISHGHDDGSLVLVDMPVREKKIATKRSPRADGGIYLTKSDHYSVKKLPSFPVNLSNSSIHFRASALPTAGFALALTHTHAYAWDYTSASGQAKVLTLPLPFGLKAADPLPFGAIVRNGPTNDFGILAIAPTTGKIKFWENVDSAEARSHFSQQHQGVDGSVKIYSGEVITRLVDIEHAGYMVVFSSGRLAQLTLRDSQGRPNIVANALSASGGSGGSFFSFKGLLGGAIRKQIASVKARPAELKGQMEVVTVTKNGLFQLWDLGWSGQHIFKQEIDMHDTLLTGLIGDAAADSRGQYEVHTLDFTILDTRERGSLKLLLLIAASGGSGLEYAVVEVDLADNVGMIARFIPLDSYKEPQIPREPTGTLLLPKPGHTALVQFPGATVVVSLAEPEEGPDAQLLSDAGRQPVPYQDTIYFRRDRNVHIAGSVVEIPSKKDRHSSILMFVQGFGVLQVSALPTATDHRVTARSRLEQATFFSTLPDNILDFAIGSRYSFAQDEVELAALQISKGILTSSFDILETVTSSMEDQIRKRSAALRNLNSHLQSDYPPLSFKGKWLLLSNAEKMAAALHIWNRYETLRQGQEISSDAHGSKPMLPDLVMMLNERYKTEIRPELGEKDPVRQYFLKDIDKLQIILPWAWQLLRTKYMDGSKELPLVMPKVSEADDIILLALETGFSFREENIASYGLDPDLLQDGLLKPGKGYDLLPEIWTSTHNVVHSTRHLTDVARGIAFDSMEAGLEELAKKIGRDNPRLVKICCQIHTERFRWSLEQSDERTRDAGAKLKQEFLEVVRPDLIYKLSEMGLATEGMNLAEHYREMPTLVRIVWEETSYLLETKEQTQSKMEEAECKVKLDRIKERVRRYFNDYGEAWAEAYYSKYISESKSARMFANEHLNQPALTKYLRADPSRARLRWINEISGEKNYQAASKALLQVADHQESNAWCKKVELSLAKLALLCGKPQGSTDNTDTHDIQDSLEYAKIQERVYDFLAPIISSALDAETGVQLLMEQFSHGRLADRTSHQELLRQGFEGLTNHRVMEPALLADVLSLLTYKHGFKSDSDVLNQEFVLALQAIALSWDKMDANVRTSALNTVWKRLYIKDDWSRLNDTTDISDEQLQGDLLGSWLGWTLSKVSKLIESDSRYSILEPPEPQSLLGAGCTHDELAPRFPSEDLRKPIINDNVLDDEILQVNLQKHRFDKWFKDTRDLLKRVDDVANEQAESVEALIQESERWTNGEGDMSLTEDVDASAYEVGDGDYEESGEQQDVEMEG